MWFPALVQHLPSTSPRESRPRTAPDMHIYTPVRIYMCVCPCVSLRTQPPACSHHPANSSRDGHTSPQSGYSLPPRAVPATAERPFPSSPGTESSKRLSFSLVVPCPSLSVRLSPRWPRRRRARSPPDNLAFLLQILNTCCPTALSRRDMCSLRPGSFACALAEVCTHPGPAAAPSPSALITASSCLVPLPVPCHCVCRVPARPRGTAAGPPAPLCHPVASSTVYMHGAARPRCVHI